MLEVVRPGPLTTVQDLGRPGLAALGVPGSGAADRRSFTLANRLVGNPEGAAALELTFGGACLRFTRPSWIAVTGAPAPWTLDGSPRPCNAPCFAPAGTTAEFGVPSRGLRTYLAVRGGIAVEPVLGSRATDLLSGLGPAPLAPGTRLPLGDEAGGFPEVDVAAVPGPPAEPVLRVIPGPRDGWFASDALSLLTGSRYEATAESNRVGVRLAGPALARRREGELPSEGMVTGALQIPPSGLPILFLADHPTTGGYPVIAVVVTDDLPLAAQLRPGDRLRFRLA
ncbi:biotin-dependent carboxyltransferase family protein [Actinocorallia sp. B10E7]|uniref:5-oxoprolinase subunit C family protein n=1 Tax=Actinocorallia sp. B10E7 TaxID=3153558 RepID=UPI00325C5C3D